MIALRKRPLGLDEPEAVQLADPLVDVFLNLRHFRGDREVNFTRPTHEVSVLPRPAVEFQPVVRMAGVEAPAVSEHARTEERAATQQNRVDN